MSPPLSDSARAATESHQAPERVHFP
jgi:hypothetical protein